MTMTLIKGKRVPPEKRSRTKAVGVKMLTEMHGIKSLLAVQKENDSLDAE